MCLTVPSSCTNMTPKPEKDWRAAALNCVISAAIPAALAAQSSDVYKRQVLDDKFLPEWAKPKLAELNAQEQTEALSGMNMK